MRRNGSECRPERKRVSSGTERGPRKVLPGKRKSLTSKTWIELFGYLGSLLVLVSFLMTSVYKLRVVNTIGSVIFAIYALIIHSYPTAFMNFCLVAINIRFLWKMSHSRKEYDLVPVRGNDAFLKHFVDSHIEDIAACFPGLHVQPETSNFAYIINCEGKPAAVFIGTEEEGTVEIGLDYATPEFRDFSVGKFLLEELPEKGIRKLIYRGPAEHHGEYLAKMGFVKEADGYVRKFGQED